MEKIDNIVVHLGHAKTGTTTIQNNLFKNKETIISKYKCLYPGDEPNHYHLQTAFSTTPADLVQVQRRGVSNHVDAAAIGRDFLEGFLDEIREYSPQRAIISSEYFASMKHEELIKMDEFLSSISDNVRYVLYLRDPWSGSTSSIQQEVMTGRVKGSTNFYYAGNIGVARHFHEIFDERLEIYPYVSSGAERTDSYSHFLRLVDIDQADVISSSTKDNMAVDYITACILSELNLIDSPISENGAYEVGPARDAVRSALIGASSGKRYFPSNRAINAISAGAAADLDWLSSCRPDIHRVFLDVLENADHSEGITGIGIEEVSSAEATHQLYVVCKQLAETVAWVRRKQPPQSKDVGQGHSSSESAWRGISIRLSYLLHQGLGQLPIATDQFRRRFARAAERRRMDF
ncbi:MAG: hypothetical protein AAGC81_02175 [Pseudomonadota bacterium]